MRSSIVAIAAALLAPSLFAATLTGRAMFYDGSAIPGCRVLLAASNGMNITATDVRGHFSVTDVAAGPATLTLILTGFGAAHRRLDIVGDTTLGTIVVHAHMANVEVMRKEPPARRDDPPSIEEYVFDTTLIDAATSGDGSALALLERRYDESASEHERIRIAGVLMAHGRDTDRIWDDLSADAANAIRFADADAWPEVETWCRDRDCDPDAYFALAAEAFFAVSSDRRARPLLIEGLDSSDRHLRIGAVVALARQHEQSALPDIDRVLQATREPMIVMQLAWYHSDAADAIASKYIDEKERSVYDAVRNRN